MRGEPLAELDHRRIVEPRIRVQLAQLPGGGVGDPRVRMAQHGHVVDHVEVGAAGRRHQVMPPAPLDLRRFAIVKLLHGSKTRVASRQQIAGVAAPPPRAARAAVADHGSAQANPAPARSRVNSGAVGCSDRAHTDLHPCIRGRVGQRFAGPHAARRHQHPHPKASARNQRPAVSGRRRDHLAVPRRDERCRDAAQMLMPVATTSGLSWLSLRVRLSRA